MDAKKLPITGPCPVDFDRSTFDAGAARRFCDHCQKSVHNLSAMSRDEAKSFLRENAGKKLCVTYRHDKSGAIAFKKVAPSTTPADIVPAASLVRHHRPARSLPVLNGRGVAPRSAAMGLAAALAACTPHAEPQTEPEPEHQPIVVIETEPEPEPLAGAVAIPEIEPDPEPEIEVEGEMRMPMGDMAIPEDAPPVEPCDPPTPDTTPEANDGPPPVLPYQPKVEPVEPDDHSVRGRIAVPRPTHAG